MSKYGKTNTDEEYKRTTIQMGKIRRRMQNPNPKTREVHKETDNAIQIRNTVLYNNLQEKNAREAIRKQVDTDLASDREFREKEHAERLAKLKKERTTEKKERTTEKKAKYTPPVKVFTLQNNNNSKKGLMIGKNQTAINNNIKKAWIDIKKTGNALSVATSDDDSSDDGLSVFSTNTPQLSSESYDD
tara:strand:+ start:444 stop:1007 length:564 start_codon:yes stop_codon:yes gene_type:complete